MEIRLTPEPGDPYAVVAGLEVTVRLRHRHPLPVGVVDVDGELGAGVELGLVRSESDPEVVGVDDAQLLGEEGLVVVGDGREVAAVRAASGVGDVPGGRLSDEGVVLAVVRSHPDRGGAGNAELQHE